MRWLALPAVLVLAVVLYIGSAKLGALGSYEGAGDPQLAKTPRAVLEARDESRSTAARLLGAGDKQILFGDLHVHSTFSSDAFYMSLPMFQGDGARPVADACDFARFCSSLDFWSINDHAESMTPREWADTKRSIRQCNAVAGDPNNPDVVAFLGWEWSQRSETPSTHYGHKNVVLLGLQDHEIPARPIAAAGRADAPRSQRRPIPLAAPLKDFWNQSRYWSYYRSLRDNADVPRCETGVPSPDLPPDCYESVPRPAGLFRKLAEWQQPAIVIPHGTTWGLYTPRGVRWDEQLQPGMHDPDRQILIEVYSGHGNTEEYRDWFEAEPDPEDVLACAPARPDYVPSCWRAGEIIEARCRESGVELRGDCERRAVRAREHYQAGRRAGSLAIPGADAHDWLDSGQCRDCFLPTFKHRPGGSVQYALAISEREPGDDGSPRRFRFGFVGSSDNHTARPGTGYKEFARKHMTDASGPRSEAWRKRRYGGPQEKTPFSRQLPPVLPPPQFERSGSFFLTGGLAAVHAAGRSRAEIWDALVRKEVYATSGERILLWFDLVNGGADGGGVVPMGGETEFRGTPRFRARAIGSPVQKPGCPDWSQQALGAEGLERICRGECWNPSDVRRKITRIEVVRIRPQTSPDEVVSTRIEDPWLVLPCPGDPAGCSAVFEDADFASAGRDSVYYVRAVQEPTDAVNGGGLRCQYDAQGECVAIRPCYADYRTDSDDDCLAPAEERAWSSPIFVDYGSS